VRPADRPAPRRLLGYDVRRFVPLALTVFLAGCAAANAGSVPISSPTDVPSPSVSATASPSQTAPSSSPAADTITVDHLARSTVDGLAVRAKAGTAGTQLGTINAGALGFVVAGPVSADGYTWYRLSAIGLPPNAGCEPPMRTTPFSCPDWLGWAAAGQPGGQAWLAATTLPCPASPMNLEALIGETAAGPRTGLAWLACYGSSAVRIRGWWPKIPADAGLGGTCPAKPATWWLQCGSLNYNGLVVSESAGFGGLGLSVDIDPASGVKMPTRGQWVEVVAHLSDAAARDCAPFGGGDQDPVRVVLSCRSEFVVESVSPVAGPY
jgi:hypothetical protein